MPITPLMPSGLNAPERAQWLTQQGYNLNTRRSIVNTVQPQSSQGMYDKAQSMLGDVTGLFQAGGAYDKAFEASKRKASDAALSQAVSAGMGNVYNPQASGAAYEAEARPAWEFGRVQGLAGAMTNAANLMAGRGSELYQGGLSRELGQLQSATSLGTANIGASTQRYVTNLREQGATERLQMQLDAKYGGNSSLPGSPFKSAKMMWG